MDEVIRGSTTRSSSSPRCSPAGTRRPPRLTWLNCGHPPAYVADPDGELHELEGPVHAALGAGGEPPLRDHAVTARERRPARARHRRHHRARDGGRRALRRRRRCGSAIADAPAPTAAATAMAIQRAVTDCWPSRSPTTRRSSSSPSTEAARSDALLARTMTAVRQALPLAVAVLALTGCGRSADRTSVRAVAEGFYAAAGDHAGARACGWLSADARQALEKDESAPCPRAVERLKLSGRRARRVEVYSTEAAVALRGGDTVYLQHTARGWRIAAAGCRAPGLRQARRICELQS